MYMTDHIKIDYRMVPYPVGSNMDMTLLVVDKYVKGFRKMNYYPGSCFNLWCRGSSGAILSALFASKLPEYTFSICHVKKEGESSHSCHKDAIREGYIDVVIDDFVSTGLTIIAILDEMEAISFYKIVPIVLILMNGLYTPPDMDLTVNRRMQKILNSFNTVISSDQNIKL